MKHTRVVSTKCTPGFACRAFSDTTLVCFIVNEHTTKCSRYDIHITYLVTPQLFMDILIWTILSPTNLNRMIFSTICPLFMQVWDVRYISLYVCLCIVAAWHMAIKAPQSMSWPHENSILYIFFRLCHGITTEGTVVFRPVSVEFIYRPSKCHDQRVFKNGLQNKKRL